MSGHAMGLSSPGASTMRSSRMGWHEPSWARSSPTRRATSVSLRPSGGQRVAMTYNRPNLSLPKRMAKMHDMEYHDEYDEDPNEDNDDEEDVQG